MSPAFLAQVQAAAHDLRHHHHYGLDIVRDRALTFSTRLGLPFFSSSSSSSSSSNASNSSSVAVERRYISRAGRTSGAQTLFAVRRRGDAVSSTAATLQTRDVGGWDTPSEASVEEMQVYRYPPPPSDCSCRDSYRSSRAGGPGRELLGVVNRNPMRSEEYSSGWSSVASSSSASPRNSGISDRADSSGSKIVNRDGDGDVRGEVVVIREPPIAEDCRTSYRPYRPGAEEGGAGSSWVREHRDPPSLRGSVVAAADDRADAERQLEAVLLASSARVNRDFGFAAWVAGRESQQQFPPPLLHDDSGAEDYRTSADDIDIPSQETRRNNDNNDEYHGNNDNDDDNDHNDSNDDENTHNETHDEHENSSHGADTTPSLPPSLPPLPTLTPLPRLRSRPLIRDPLRRQARVWDAEGGDANFFATLGHALAVPTTAAPGAAVAEEAAGPVSATEGRTEQTTRETERCAVATVTDGPETILPHLSARELRRRGAPVQQVSPRETANVYEFTDTIRYRIPYQERHAAAAAAEETEKAGLIESRRRLPPPPPPGETVPIVVRAQIHDIETESSGWRRRDEGDAVYTSPREEGHHTHTPTHTPAPTPNPSHGQQQRPQPLHHRFSVSQYLKQKPLPPTPSPSPSSPPPPPPPPTPPKRTILAKTAAAAAATALIFTDQEFPLRLTREGLGSRLPLHLLRASAGVVVKRKPVPVPIPRIVRTGPTVREGGGGTVVERERREGEEGMGGGTGVITTAAVKASDDDDDNDDGSSSGAGVEDTSSSPSSSTAPSTTTDTSNEDKKTDWKRPLTLHTSHWTPFPGDWAQPYILDPTDASDRAAAMIPPVTPPGIQTNTTTKAGAGAAPSIPEQSNGDNEDHEHERSDDWRKSNRLTLHTGEWKPFLGDWTERFSSE